MNVKIRRFSDHSKATRELGGYFFQTVLLLFSIVLFAAPGQAANSYKESQSSKKHKAFNDFEKQPKQRRLPPGTQLIENLEYANITGESLLLDLMLPEKGKQKPPLVMWIHGGGWRSGDKVSINPVSARLTADGYAVAAINYRLGGLQAHPNHIHDCKGALRWLRANASQYGYDPERVAVVGGSAGGHLALLLGLSSGNKALEGTVGGNLDQSTEVNAIVDLFGVADMKVFALESHDFKRKQPKEFFLSASPVEYISANDPPLLIIHGTRDQTVPVSQSKDLHTRYLAAGLESSLHIIEGGEHGGRVYSDDTRYELIKNFLDTHLKSATPIKKRPVSALPPTKTIISSDNSAGAATNNRLKGFHWMVGPKNGLAGDDRKYQKLLKTVDSNLKSNRCIDGVYVMTHWSLIQPEANQWQLDRLDGLLKTIKQNGRYYKLAVSAGVNTPDWVYRAGAEAFTTIGPNPSRKDTYNKPLKMPVPWDNTYQKRYFEALTKISERYKKDAEFRGIALTVATFQSPEWHLPQSKDDLRKWRSYGDYAQRLESAWKKGIDQFAQLFPQQMLVLEASSYPLKLQETSDAIVAYAATSYPDRFAVQINQLTGAYDQIDRTTYSKILGYREKYGKHLVVGMQNLKGWTSPTLADKQGSKEMTAYNYVQSGAQYWELWFGDGRTANTCSELDKLQSDISRSGLQAARKAMEKKNTYVGIRSPKSKHPYQKSGN